MRIRKNIFPRRILDMLCFLLIAVFLPIVYIFEMSVVLPAIHEIGGFFHTFTFVLAIFIIFNITGNMLACILVDTSVNVITKPSPENAETLGWKFCKICQKLVPPRAWHCKICQTCILKRDHHCLFTGCCIGHRNQRFFLMFVIYLFIGSMYAFVYNSVFLFVLNSFRYANILMLFKVLCPILFLLTGNIWSQQNQYFLFYGLNIVALTFSILLLFYHWPNILKGAVSYDRNKNNLYDAGWKENLRIVMGKRAKLAWLSPLIKSDLVSDGTHWEKKQIDDCNKKHE